MVLLLSVPVIVPDISEVSVVVVESVETEGSVESAKSVAPVGKVLSVGNAESLDDDGAAPAVLLGKACRSIFKPFRPL